MNTYRRENRVARGRGARNAWVRHSVRGFGSGFPLSERSDDFPCITNGGAREGSSPRISRTRAVGVTTEGTVVIIIFTTPSFHSIPAQSLPFQVSILHRRAVRMARFSGEPPVPARRRFLTGRRVTTSLFAMGRSPRIAIWHVTWKSRWLGWVMPKKIRLTYRLPAQTPCLTFNPKIVPLRGIRSSRLRREKPSHEAFDTREIHQNQRSF